MSAVGALRACLQVLEDEILRIAKQASESPDQSVQDNYWHLAQDLQREARELRQQIKKSSEASSQLAFRSSS
jgi:hypothetical protein